MPRSRPVSGDLQFEFDEIFHERRSSRAKSEVSEVIDVEEQSDESTETISARESDVAISNFPGPTKVTPVAFAFNPVAPAFVPSFATVSRAPEGAALSPILKTLPPRAPGLQPGVVNSPSPIQSQHLKEILPSPCAAVPLPEPARVNKVLDFPLAAPVTSAELACTPPSQSVEDTSELTQIGQALFGADVSSNCSQPLSVDVSATDCKPEIEQALPTPPTKEAPAATPECGTTQKLVGAKVSLEDFEKLHLIGQGGFGKVYLVRKIDTGAVYAMKSMRKDIVLKNMEGTRAERSILEKFDHPFIVSLHYAFQSDRRLFFVMDHVNGGQMLLHLEQQGSFNEDTTRFYAAEIVLALEELHSRGIIHRDLKPENILLDAEGHVSVTDFGCSKDLLTSKDGRTRSFVGTDMYMAPEQITAKDKTGTSYSFPVDWWALGVLVWEMLMGENPFDCKTKAASIKKVMKLKLSLPSYYTAETHSLLKGFHQNRLLNRDCKRRLGANGTAEVKNHSFFKKINWDKMLKRDVPPPFRPNVPSGPLDVSNVREKYIQAPIAESPMDSTLAASDQLLFQGFTFERESPFRARAEAEARQEKLQAEVDAAEERQAQRERDEEEEFWLQQEEEALFEAADWEERAMAGKGGHAGAIAHHHYPGRPKIPQAEFHLDVASMAKATMLAGPAHPAGGAAAAKRTNSARSHGHKENKVIDHGSKRDSWAELDMDG